MESLIAANIKLSLDLFKNITEHQQMDNIFYSPFSLSTALSMVYMGARGNTAIQMAEVLRFRKEKGPEASGLQQQQVKRQLPQEELKSPHHESDDDIHAEFNKLMSELNKEGAPYALSLANRLYGDKSLKFVEKYLMDTNKFYQAELEPVDFQSNPEGARLHINSWVEKQTQDKIKDLLADGVITTLTRLVLVNAIYFKGEWDNKFKGEDTNEEEFRLTKNESKPVQMMRQNTKFNLASIPEVNCQILEMPYIGKELSMLIILPREIEDDSTGLERLERKLTYKKLLEWTQPDKMDHVELMVALPKFKMEETYNLGDILFDMGMKDVFIESKSDLSGISSSGNLVVSKVVHKAFVAVNEEGTEAAAATAVVIGVRSVMPPPHQFIADHPFLFFIRHNATQSILFNGRFCSP